MTFRGGFAKRVRISLAEHEEQRTSQHPSEEIRIAQPIPGYHLPSDTNAQRAAVEQHRILISTALPGQFIQKLTVGMETIGLAHELLSFLFVFARFAFGARGRRFLEIEITERNKLFEFLITHHADRSHVWAELREFYFRDLGLGDLARFVQQFIEPFRHSSPFQKKSGVISDGQNYTTQLFTDQFLSGVTLFVWKLHFYFSKHFLERFCIIDSIAIEVIIEIDVHTLHFLSRFAYKHSPLLKLLI